MAATRFNFAASGTPAATPTPHANWDITTSFAARPLLLASQLGSGTFGNDTSLTETSTSIVNRLKRQHVSTSTVLAAHTISGTMQWVIKGNESAAGADAKLQIIAYVIDGSGAFVGTLYAGNASNTVNTTVGDIDEELGTSGATRVFGPVTVTSQAVLPGYRIVVELGYRATNTVATSFGVTFNIDDRVSSTDFAFTSGLTTTLRGWVEFSDDIFAPAVGVAAGSFAFSESATAQVPTAADGAGSITLSGTADSIAPPASGSLALSGSAGAAAHSVATGSMTFGGSAGAASSVTTAGSLAFSGSAGAEVTAAASGAITLAGASSAAGPATAAGTLDLIGSVFDLNSSIGHGTIDLGGSAGSTITISANMNFALTMGVVIPIGDAVVIRDDGYHHVELLGMWLGGDHVEVPLELVNEYDGTVYIPIGSPV